MQTEGWDDTKLEGGVKKQQDKYHGYRAAPL